MATRSPLEMLQPLGRALMLPIAVLPAAGLLLRLGQPDLLNIPFLAAAGDAVFSNLGLLFAIGVAVGLARENNGAAGLAGVVAFLIAVKGAQALMTPPPEALKAFTGPAAELAAAAFKDKALAKLAVPIGIASGLIGGLFYNRFSDIRLPEYLAFFGGRRFVPIVSGLAGVGLALIVGLGYGAINGGMDALSRAIVGSGEWGLFAFGVLNRLLIVTGLHHILNNVAWFVIGDYHGKTGDLNRFFAGDPTAGAFMTGFFPVIMFGLPAACLAMYHAARPERRKAVGGMLLSLALTAFLTGVTEPIEFSFMFLAPILFALHAVLTGAAMAGMHVLGVRMGFGFSAGLFDYVLNFGKATRPSLLLPVGAVYFVIYYGLFRLFIQRFDLKTPGREEVETDPPDAAPVSADDRGAAFVAALGGPGNLVTVDACTTRLRLIVGAQADVSEARLRSLGARGFIRPSERALQVVLGPIADQVAGEMRKAIAAGPASAVAIAPAPPPSAAWEGTAPSVVIDEGRAHGLLTALGGAQNVRAVTDCDRRLVVELSAPTLSDPSALAALGVLATAVVDPHTLHLILDRPAAADRTAVCALLV